MKRKSIKFRLTIWFTAILAAICAVILAIVVISFQTFGEMDTKDQLTEIINSYSERIKVHKTVSDAFQSVTENMEVKSIDFLQHNIQIMAYHENGEHSLGIFKFDELDEVPYNSSPEPAEITLDGTKYYYYDSWVNIPREPDIWIRGIVPAQESMQSILMSHKFLLLLIPLLTLLAFFGGYMLTGNFLRPVAKITATADEIRRSSDPSCMHFRRKHHIIGFRFGKPLCASSSLSYISNRKITAPKTPESNIISIGGGAEHFAFL